MGIITGFKIIVVNRCKRIFFVSDDTNSLVKEFENC